MQCIWQIRPSVYLIPATKRCFEAKKHYWSTHFPDLVYITSVHLKATILLISHPVQVYFRRKKLECVAMPSMMVTFPYTTDAEFWQNTQIFVSTATWVGKWQIWITPLNWPSRKSPVWYKNLKRIYTSRVILIANFTFKYSHFRYLGNLERSLNDTIKLVDPQNPSLVQESVTYLLYRPSYSKC